MLKKIKEKFSTKEEAKTLSPTCLHTQQGKQLELLAFTTQKIHINPNCYLNESELSCLTGLSKKFLQDNRWKGGQGSIPYHKVGARVLYHYPTVKTFLAECERKNTTQVGGNNM